MSSNSDKTVLALGGHFKCAPVLQKSGQVFIGRLFDDLEGPENRQQYEKTIDDLLAKAGGKVDLIVCDAHPDYASTYLAENLSRQLTTPLIRVQHHEAHVGAFLVKDQYAQAFGLAWDGTGYGLDGHIWGSECLIYQDETFKRMAFLRSFSLPGGNQGVRQPRRALLGVLYELFGSEAAIYVEPFFNRQELANLMRLLKKPFNTPRTSSMGRLFDAFACFLGLYPTCESEGQAAVALEKLIDVDEKDSYPFGLLEDQIDWSPVWQRALEDQFHGVTRERMSARFHRGLVDLGLHLAKKSGLNNIVLSGGCFQNSYLKTQLTQALERAGYYVIKQPDLSPGDASLALGQVFVALKRI